MVSEIMAARSTSRTGL